MIQLLLLRKKLICNLDYGIVVPKAIGKLVDSELIRYEALQIVLYIHYKLLLE